MPEDMQESQKHELRVHKPEFDGGNFTIEFLSYSPTGFKVRTRHSLLRHAPDAPFPEAKRIKSLKEEKRFRVGPGFKPLVGIRNVERDGNVLAVDIKPVTFPTYKVISSPTEPEASLDVSNPSATALILLTTESDGSHKLLIQHRSEKNFFYGDVLGASVAGYLDGKLDRRRENRGRLLPIDTNYIIENIQKEAIEEIGIKPEELIETRITGVASDKVRIHNEFLLLGITSLTAGEIAKKIGEGDEFVSGEKIFVIDATPEAIATLLTKVKSPVPPTHLASLIAAGYAMVLEKEGIDAANRWKETIEEGIRRNYREIDQIVAQFYEDHPEVLVQIPEGKPSRNPKAYEPVYTPQQQGLPDVVSELKRVELV